jgi:hypothetical protein
MGHGAEEMKYRFQWNFPIFFSPHDPNKLYTASNHLHVSTNEGESWELISPDLTRNDPSKLGPSGGPITKDNTSVEYYCTIFAAAESPVTPGLLWTGSDDGLVHVSRDGGKNWDNVTPAGMPEWMMINSIEPSVHDAGTCYIAGTKYKTGDFTPYLYKTTDYGKSWKKITNGIEAEHFTRVLREDSKQKGLLYAGTETGMYISFSDGANWEKFQLNLPIVPITDLKVKEDNLIVATQGRSLWIIDDLTVIRQLASAKGKDMYLYKPKPTYRMGGNGRKGSLTSGTNHPAGVMTYFYIKDSKDKEVQLHYLNQRGDTLKTYGTKHKENKLNVEDGANYHSWNLRGEGAERLKGMILWWASTEAPKAVPGNYSAVLEVGDEVLRQPFEILPDPNAETDIAGMQRQFDFITDVNKTIDRAHKSIKKIRAINDQLEAFQKQYKGQEDVKDLVDKAKELSEQFGDIEKALYQTQNRSGQDPLNFPIRLTNKLAHLNSLVDMDDFPPTEQDVAVKNELTRRINAELVKFDQLVSGEIKAFNAAFNQKQLNYLFVEE